MRWLAYLAGGFLVLWGLNELFRTLLHPRGRGRLSRWLFRLFWRLRGRGGGTLVGVSGVVTSIVAWVVLEIVGWALLILPLIPQGLSYSQGIRPSAYPPFAQGIYFSLVTFSTVGYGDVVVVDPVLRMLAPLEALVGFAVVTASLSWFSQLYPALARRRTLALRLRALDTADAPAHAFPIDADSGAVVLMGLAEAVAQVAVDLEQNSETYYFRERDVESTLPAMLLRLRRLVAVAVSSEDEMLRWHGRVLQTAVAQLVEVLRHQVGPTAGDTDAVILAVARDYGVPAPELAG